MRGEELAQQKSTPEKEVKLKSFSFNLGSDHPVYHVIPDRIPQIKAPYAYYIRVADLPGFLNQITPVLEERLANSVMAGYSCELKLNLYTGGVRMQLEKGKFTKIEAYSGEDASANFPNLTFLHLLFGSRDVQTLSENYVDMYCRSEFAKPLLDALFPTKPSYVFNIA